MNRGAYRGNPCKWCLQHGFTIEYSFQHRRECRYFKCKCPWCASVWSAEPRKPNQPTAAHRPPAVKRNPTEKSEPQSVYCVRCKNHGLQIYAIGRHSDYCKFRDCKCSPCVEANCRPATGHASATINKSQVSQVPRNCPFCAHHQKVVPFKKPHSENCKLRNKCKCALCAAEHKKLKGDDVRPKAPVTNPKAPVTNPKVVEERQVEEARPSEVDEGRKRKRSTSPPPVPRKQLKSKEPDVYNDCWYCVNHGWNFPFKDHHYGVCMYKRCVCDLCAAARKEHKGSARAERLVGGDIDSGTSQAVGTVDSTDRALQTGGPSETANVVARTSDLQETSGSSARAPGNEGAEVKDRRSTESETSASVEKSKTTPLEENPQTAVSTEHSGFAETTERETSPAVAEGREAPLPEDGPLTAVPTEPPGIAKTTECETSAAVAEERETSEDEPPTAVSRELSGLAETAENVPENGLLVVVLPDAEDRRSNSDDREVISGESFIVVDELNEASSPLQEGTDISTDGTVKEDCERTGTLCSGSQSETCGVAVGKGTAFEDGPQTAVSAEIDEVSETTENLAEGLTVVSTSAEDTQTDDTEFIAGESYIVVDDLNRVDSSLEKGLGLDTNVNIKAEFEDVETPCSSALTTEVLDGECFIVLDEISDNTKMVCSPATSSLGDEPSVLSATTPSDTESTSCENGTNANCQVLPEDRTDEIGLIHELVADILLQVCGGNDPANTLCTATRPCPESSLTLSTDTESSNSKVLLSDDVHEAPCVSSDVSCDKWTDSQAVHSSATLRSRKNSLDGKKPCAVVAPKPRGSVRSVEPEGDEGCLESEGAGGTKSLPEPDESSCASTVVSSDFTTLMAELANLEQNYQRAVPYSRTSSTEGYSISPVMDREQLLPGKSVLVHPKNLEIPSGRSIASEILPSRERRSFAVENLLCDVCGKVFDSYELFHLHSHWHQDGNSEASRAKARWNLAFKSNTSSVSGSKASVIQGPILCSREAEGEISKPAAGVLNKKTEVSCFNEKQLAVGCICYVCGVAFPTVHQCRLHAYIKHDGIDIESTDQRFHCRTCSFEDSNEIMVDEHESAHLGLVPLDRVLFLFSSLKNVIGNYQATQP